MSLAHATSPIAIPEEILVRISSQWLRLAHHGVMGLLIDFITNPLYSGWLMNVMKRNGTISGIFSGYRFIEPKDQ